jgi:hypothetical protein
MGKNYIKILIPIVFIFYTCAFLELDFGGRCEQTWHDEYDSYTISSITSCPDCHSFSFVCQSNAVLSIHDGPIISKVQVAENTTVDFWFGLKDNKGFIKHRVLLI